MLDVIEQIKQVEDKANNIKKQAQQSIGTIQATAHKNGKELVTATKAKATADGAVLIQQAEAKAKAFLEQNYNATKTECDAVLANAAARRHQAAELIVERIVGGI